MGVEAKKQLKAANGAMKLSEWAQWLEERQICKTPAFFPIPQLCG